MITFVSPCSLNFGNNINSYKSSSTTTNRTTYRPCYITTKNKFKIKCNVRSNEQDEKLQSEIKNNEIPINTTTTPDNNNKNNNNNNGYDLQPNEIAVRFINTPSGNDVVAAATPGDPLLRVGDSVGVSIPRACQSGLCGSCTCDVLDTNAQDGRQTIRACQASAFIPDNGTELIVDVERMKSFKGKVKDPMARFENLDTDYVAGAAPGMSKGALSNYPVPCRDCDGQGLIQCYNCEGLGLEGEDENEEDTAKMRTCNICIGMKTVRCATCQGMGELVKSL